MNIRIWIKTFINFLKDKEDLFDNLNEKEVKELEKYLKKNESKLKKRHQKLEYRVYKLSKRKIIRKIYENEFGSTKDMDEFIEEYENEHQIK